MLLLMSDKTTTSLTRRLMTDIDLGSMLGMAANRVRRMVRQGQVPFVRLPTGDIRFDPDDVQEWLEKCRCATNNEDATIDVAQ